MMTLAEKRKAIHHLLSERHPGDAMATYFACYHPDEKTQLTITPADEVRAAGYVAVSRTGLDLFRPLLTMRLPAGDVEAGADLIYQALPAGTAVFVHAPATYLALLQALFDIQLEEHLRLFVLDGDRFQPVINVLVAQAKSANGLPRFVVRSEVAGNEVVASANLNWQSPHFAEIAVNTHARHRRRGWGRSVVAAMVQYLQQNGRQPLYAMAETNLASERLATDLGFVDSGLRSVMIQGTLRPRP